ncbi:MAG: hypothetical protein K2Q15_16210 [Burkholderiales bacterium]|nr:hypothetical protein [Burkholderiales bacterium]
MRIPVAAPVPMRNLPDIKMSEVKAEVKTVEDRHHSLPCNGIGGPLSNDSKKPLPSSFIDSDDQMVLAGIGSSQLNRDLDNNYFEGIFGLIRENHLSEAQEFRRKGHNRQEPKINQSLLIHLETEVKVLEEETKTIKLANWKLKLPDDFFRCVDSLKEITRKLDDANIPDWITEEVKYSESGKEHMGSGEMGSRKDAQSLVRRLDATIKALTSVAITLKHAGIYAHRDTLDEEVRNTLIQEIADIFNGNIAENSYPIVKSELEILEKKKTVDNDKADWLQLLGMRGESLKACRSDELKNTI